MYRPPTGSLRSSGTENRTELIEFLNEETAGTRTMFVGNVDSRVTRKLLYELMMQAGPVEAIRLVPPREGTNKTIAFVRFEHASSVRYAMLIFEGVSLFRSSLSLNYSGMHKSKPSPTMPEQPTTFFELPIGLEKVSDATKEQLVRAQAVPPAEYISGYYVSDTDPSSGTSQSVEPQRVRRDAHRKNENESASYHDRGREDRRPARTDSYSERTPRHHDAHSSYRQSSSSRDEYDGGYRQEAEYGGYDQYRAHGYSQEANYARAHSQNQFQNYGRSQSYRDRDSYGYQDYGGGGGSYDESYGRDSQYPSSHGAGQHQSNKRQQR